MHTKKISNQKLNLLISSLLKLIKSKIKIAITGHTGVIGTSFIKKYKNEFKFIKFNDDLTDTKKIKIMDQKVNAEAFTFC